MGWSEKTILGGRSKKQGMGGARAPESSQSSEKNRGSWRTKRKGTGSCSWTTKDAAQIKERKEGSVLGVTRPKDPCVTCLGCQAGPKIFKGKRTGTISFRSKKKSHQRKSHFKVFRRIWGEKQKEL